MVEILSLILCFIMLFFCICHVSFIEDKLLLKGSRNGVFSIMLMYRVLYFSPDVPFSFHSTWNPIIPPKIAFFAWEAS